MDAFIFNESGKGFNSDGTMYALNTTEQHSVCYGISRSMLKGGMNAGGMPLGENVQPSLTANGTGAVCYDARGNGNGFVVPTLTGDHQNRITDYTAVICYNNRREADYRIAEDNVVPTVCAKFGTGGGNTPLVLCVIASTSTNAEMTDGSISPTVLNRAGTGGNQLPIVVLKKENE